MASNTKHRKNHKQKLAARNNRLAQEKAQAQKFQKEFIMNLIKQEQEKGLFDNTPSINTSIDGPSIDGPVIEGPSI
jgi:uncharacterized protein YjgD (DUF1641 family)